MNEDIERQLAMSQEFAYVIIEAYKRRFPERTADSMGVTVNSLLIALVSYIKTFDFEDRQTIIEAVLQSIDKAMEDD